MATNNRVIEDEQARQMLVRFIQAKQLPFTVSIADGKHRSTEQNKLQRKWMDEIAADLGERAEYWRGYCKLHFGIPILRNENDSFRAEYDAVVKPLPYEAKLKLMMVPFDFGVTRLMTVKQLTAYLDDVHRHFSGQGVALTDPDERRKAA